MDSRCGYDSLVFACPAFPWAGRRGPYLLDVWQRHNVRPAVEVAHTARHAQAARPDARWADARLARLGRALQVEAQLGDGAAERLKACALANVRLNAVRVCELEDGAAGVKQRDAIAEVGDCDEAADDEAQRDGCACRRAQGVCERRCGSGCVGAGVAIMQRDAVSQVGRQ
eukprot:63053-Chlamydomonas_euryale.AAC.1